MAALLLPRYAAQRESLCLEILHESLLHQRREAILLHRHPFAAETSALLPAPTRPRARPCRCAPGLRRGKAVVRERRGVGRAGGRCGRGSPDASRFHVICFLTAGGPSALSSPLVRLSSHSSFAFDLPLLYLHFPLYFPHLSLRMSRPLLPSGLPKHQPSSPYTPCPDGTIPRTRQGFTPGRVKVGFPVHLVCDAGYQVAGNADPKCLADGSYDHPGKCVEVVCPPYEAPAHGSVVPTTSTEVGQHVNITCDDGYDLEGDDSPVCQEDGTYSGKSSPARPLARVSSVCIACVACLQRVYSLRQPLAVVLCCPPLARRCRHRPYRSRGTDLI